MPKLCEQQKKQSTSVTFIAGDFNSKIGKKEETERCIGSWSRGIRNENGIRLTTFCKQNDLIITNSCFQHPAKHITTWSQQRKDKDTNTIKTIYNQIDYILCDYKYKHILIDSRTYSGTETHSDH